jgi:ankyrin repeat protein
MFGRHENIDLILKTSANLLNLRNKKGMSALAYACKYGHTKAVEVLLRHKAKLNFGVGQARMPPIIWAAAYGHYELVEFLLENKARVLSKDKFKRTALIMAVRNGYSKIASLLLQRGSEWNH